MKHAPPGYECPFCRLQTSPPSALLEAAIVLDEPRVFAFVPLHYYASIKGNCLIAPRLHYENIFDLPEDLGSDIFRVTRRLAEAMRHVFGCGGISTRQHNGPVGDQDVWHYHLHIFPRFQNDGLYGGRKNLYAPGERQALADQLRAALAPA